MTSVQKFLRQRILTTSFLQAPTERCYYIFVATSGNYVGNYPPGYMQQVAADAIPAPGQGTLIRDMGKTIKAPITLLGTPGFFREVQLITPVALAGATASSTFGVGINSAGAQTLPAAGNVGDTGYGTYYIPIIIDGVIATTNGTTPATMPNTYLPFGGQM